MSDKNQTTQERKGKKSFLRGTNLSQDDMKDVHIFEALTPPLYQPINSNQRQDKQQDISILIVNQNSKFSQ